MEVKAYLLEELSAIGDQLKNQVYELSEREKILDEREHALAEREKLAESTLQKLTHQEACLKEREALLLEVEDHVAVCYRAMEECIQKGVRNDVEALMKKENVRLRDGLKSVCTMNDKLKMQLEQMKLESYRAKKQLTFVKARLASSKLSEQQSELKADSSHKSQKSEQTNTNHKVDSNHQLVHQSKPLHRKSSPSKEQENERQRLLEHLVYSLVQWISTALVAVNEKETSGLCDMLCTSTFSVLALLLPSVPSHHHLLCLQFICRVLFHASPKAKTSVGSSLRRIGEVCSSSYTCSKSSPLDHHFCGSSDRRIRVHSCLVILHSTVQVDILSQALQSFKCDLKYPEMQDEFISLGGFQATLPYVCSSPKFTVLLDAVLDIYLLISSDGGHKYFLNSEWFGVVSDLLKENRVSTPHLEKLSILLQRLSTLRQSRVLFSRFGLVPVLQSLLASREGLTSFIQLNFSSIITNLLFEDAVSCVLADWAALQIIVENSLGGINTREKAKWLVTVTADFIQHTEHVSSTDIDEYLSTLLDQEFDTLVEDGSLDAVSKQLVDFWTKCNQNKLHEVREYVSRMKNKGSPVLVELLPLQQNSCRTPEMEGRELDSKSEELDCSEPKGKEDDDEGWTVVRNK